MENFAGASRRLVQNSIVTRAAIFGLAALFAGTFSLSAQQTGFDPIFGFYRPELSGTFDSSDLVRDLSMRGFLDGRLPGSTSLGKMGTAPVANFPATLADATPHHKTNSAPQHLIDPKDGKDHSSADAIEKASLTWTGGEVGFMYGHVTGKWGGDLFSTYITGGVGNDKMQINVGAEYDEFHGRVPRWRP
jgi:hypothetical protein